MLIVIGNWKLEIGNSSAMPLILETKHDNVIEDIKILKKLRDKN